MYCSSCGAKLDDDAKFCTNCGTSIDQDGKETIQNEILQNDEQIRNQPIGKVILGIIRESAEWSFAIVLPYFAVLFFLCIGFFALNMFGRAFYQWLSLLPIVIGFVCYVFVVSSIADLYWLRRPQSRKRFDFFSFLEIVGIVVTLILSIRACTSPSSKYIETVQKGHMDINQEETVEEVLESNFKHSKWKCYKNKSDEYVVQYEGNRDFTDVTIQFVVDPEDSSFYIDSIQVDGEKLNAIESATAVSLLFGE